MRRRKLLSVASPHVDGCSCLWCILPRDVRTLTFCQLMLKVKLLAGERKATELQFPHPAAILSGVDLGYILHFTSDSK